MEHNFPIVSISSCYNYATPIETQIDRVASAGFTHYSLGANLDHFDYSKKAACTELRRKCDCFDLRFDTVHGRSLDRHDAVDVLSAAMDAAHELGAATVVIHPVSFVLRPETADARLNTIRRNMEGLCRCLESYPSIRVAIENVMPGPSTDLIDDILSEVGLPNLGFCYDSSHEQVDGPREYELIGKHAAHLFAVHLSDRSREFVDHQIPGEGFVDFDHIASALSGVGYDRPVLLEVMMTHSRFKEESEFLTQAFRAADRLYRLIHGM